MNKSLLFIAAASMCIVFPACHSGAQKNDAAPSENTAPAAEAPAAAAPSESAPEAEAPKAEEAPAAEAAQNAPNDEKAAVPRKDEDPLRPPLLPRKPPGGFRDPRRKQVRGRRWMVSG